jgi:hypothetical protein
MVVVAGGMIAGASVGTSHSILSKQRQQQQQGEEAAKAVLLPVQPTGIVDAPSIYAAATPQLQPMGFRVAVAVPAAAGAQDNCNKWFNGPEVRFLYQLLLQSHWSCLVDVVLWYSRNNQFILSNGGSGVDTTGLSLVFI